ncbi:hypothetical protein [Micromonospora sp. LOL_024]|uniref:hypothetical protein n=1 Tax=Micromonospora sp. LOL_024 TaxID=3345412 RepID=UPI003A85831A
MDLYAQAAALPRQIPMGLPPKQFSQLRDEGLSAGAIRWRASRTTYLHRVHQGYYVPGPDEPGLLSRARCALRAASPLVVLGFQSAAQLHGFGVAQSQKIHVLAPATTPFPQRRGVIAHQSVLPLDHVIRVLGLPCAPPARCAVDLARTLPRRQALPVLDAALFAGAVDSAELLAEVARHDGLRGVRQARELVPLADGRAECRQETLLRLILHDAGITGFVPQFPVPQAGRLRYRLDLGDPHHLIAVEYDGSSHLDANRLRRDRSRHNWLQRQGWLVHYATAADLYDPSSIIEALLAARRSRANRRRRRSSHGDTP